jgi:hypothetical protein
VSFFNRTVAQTYIRELKIHLDRKYVPVFTPDTAIEVGDFGALEDGRFVKRGNLADRGLTLDILETQVAAQTFASTGKVTISASATVEVAGQKLLGATLTFKKSKAIVTAFRSGVDQGVRDADRFADQLAALWTSKELRTDRAVVWHVRRAHGGTVIVSQDGNNSVALTADPTKLAAPAINFGNLSLHVELGTAKKAVWTIPPQDGDLVVSMGLYRWGGSEAKDAFGFATAAPEATNGRAALVGADDLLAQLTEEPTTA